MDDFRDWKYSSYGTILTDKPTHLQRDTVLDWFGGKDEIIKRHDEMEKDKVFPGWEYRQFFRESIIELNL